MAEYKVYHYTQFRTLKSGEIKEYPLIVTRKINKKPKSEHLPKIHSHPRKDMIGEELRKEIYAQHLRGITQKQIAVDVGLCMLTISRVIKREKELASSINTANNTIDQ